MAEYKRTLKRFEEAVRAHEMLGATPPEGWPAIEREYEHAKQALVRKLQYRALKEPIVQPNQAKT